MTSSQNCYTRHMTEILNQVHFVFQSLLSKCNTNLLSQNLWPFHSSDLWPPLFFFYEVFNLEVVPNFYIYIDTYVYVNPPNIC